MLLLACAVWGCGEIIDAWSRHMAFVVYMVCWQSAEMAFAFNVLGFFLFALRAQSLTTNASYARITEASTFMVVSGITATHEFCLSVEEG